MMRKRWVLLLALVLCAAASASAEGLVYARDGGHHVTGEIVVNGYTFYIDAALEEDLPGASRVSYAARPFDRQAWEAAIRDCFPQNADDLIPRLGQQGHDVCTVDSHPYLPYPVVLPAAENAPDEWLSARLGQCEAFLTAMGIPFDAMPFSAAYTAPRQDSAFGLYLDASERDDATGANICYLLTAQGIPVIVYQQLSRHNGSLDYSGRVVVTDHPLAQFSFDLEGNLTGFYVGGFEATASGAAPAAFLSWEDALTLMLNDYTSYDVIRNNLAQFSYTVTDIRCAWDMTFENTGRPGWMISLSAKSAHDASPTGWINRCYTCFVYGGP